ncbi:trichohyalin isoform X2 [Amia ocellicauda]|uniref:trichohyalin isoform X2 n=1 Tax=Amia ocellicauda TaxID=2972642 RepID=UPI0034641DAB
MEQQEERAELEDIVLRLRADGLDPGATADERLRHLWRLFLRSEGSLVSVTQDLQTLRTQQATEMKEVENYVDHIRNLSEERESLTAEYERENEQLRLDMQQLRIHQEAQLKEVEEMLEQEGLGEITHSSPSEQIAYLLVERATLLEKLEAAERKLDTQSLTGSLREVHLQEELDQIRQTLEEELRQQRESMQRTKETMNKDLQSPGQSPWKKLFGVRKAAQSTRDDPSAHWDELSGERLERQRLERDLDEASRRLAMAHEEIRRLSDELDSARKTQGHRGLQSAVHPGFGDRDQCNPSQRLCPPEPQLERARQEVEEIDLLDLQKAKEHNERLDREILALRNRVRSLDSERKTLLEMVQNHNVQSNREVVINTEEPLSLAAHLAQGNGTQDPAVSPPQETTAGDATQRDQEHLEQIHKRCRQDSEDKACRLRELERRLRKLQQEHEELVERNEELESLLGEAQNQSKEDRDRYECEAEGLHRKVKRLESELTRRSQSTQEPPRTGGDQPHTPGSDPDVYLQQTQSSSQERVAVLEGRLMEETEWRQQLEVDLGAAQAALKKEKEELQRTLDELRRLRMEAQTLRAGLQEGNSVSVNLSHVQRERDILEQKVCELDRAKKRVDSDLEMQSASARRGQEDLRETRARLAELSAQTGALRAELGNLERERKALRGEVAEGRAQLATLQRQLNDSAQERLRLQEERQRLGLELQCVKEQLQSTRQEGQRLRQASQDPSPAASDRPKDECLSQLVSLKVEMGRLQTTLEEERLLAGQHQLALQAQISEAQSRTKSQDSLLQQKGEECRLLRQDVQRVQNLFTSAERELRYEREKNLDLKRHNALLDQEKVKAGVELKQAQTRLAQLEQSQAALAGELERAQDRARELELDLARSSQSRQAQHSLQEELSVERARLLSTDKKVLELQQQLKSAVHQLRLEETRAGETERLQRDSRDMSDTLAGLRAKLHEEQLHRKLLEQREEELQQQVRALREKEAALGRAGAELRHRLQQQDTRVGVLEVECSAARDELHGQKTNQRLSEQLLSSQQELERLQEELQQVLQQLDSQIRKYNEKQSQYKTKLRKAKQVFMKETTDRDCRIQKLENDLALATSLAEKEKCWIKQVTEENEKLLTEKRDLLKKLSEEEEIGQGSLRTASTIQHRVNFLEEENRQLQDRTLQLCSQVAALERALRNVQSVRSLEELKKIFPSESLLLNGSVLRSTSPSLGDTLGILDAIRRVKVGEHPEGIRSSFAVPPRSAPSEIGYLNVSSPAGPARPQDPDESLSLGSDEV